MSFSFPLSTQTTPTASIELACRFHVFHHLLSTLGFSLTSTDQQSVDPHCFICTHSAPPPSSDSSSNTAQKDSLSSGCVSHVQLSYELAKPQRGRFEPRLVDANASTLQWPDRLYALPSVSVAMVTLRLCSQKMACWHWVGVAVAQRARSGQGQRRTGGYD